MRYLLPLVAAVCMFLSPAAWAEVIGTDTVRNPTKHRYEDAPVRLRVPYTQKVAGDELRVECDGVVVPHRLVFSYESGELFPEALFGLGNRWTAEPIDETAQVWVQVTLDPGEAKTYKLIRTEGDGQMHMGMFGDGEGGEDEDDYSGSELLRMRADLVEPRLEIRVPGLDGPIGAARWMHGTLTEKENHPGNAFPWVDSEKEAPFRIWWDTATEETGEINEDFGTKKTSDVRDVQAWFVRNKHYIMFREDGAMAEGDAWALDITAGWSPTHAVMRRWYKAEFAGSDGIEKFPLDPAALEGISRNAGEGVAVRLLPRWTQSPDEGWFFGVTDGERVVGVMPIRAGEWRWPHENAIVARVPERGKAELVFPTHRGARTWLLIAGPVSLLEELDEIARETSHAPLDKLHNEYVLSSDGARKRRSDGGGEESDAATKRRSDGGKEGKRELITTRDFFSNDTNPTGGLRQEGRRLVKDALAGKTSGSVQMLYDAQATFDPDWYGRYEDGWSPINPNFYTDFLKPGIARTAMLREHPRFEELRARAEAAFRSDVAHSVTLPGGAGQECPGYQAHAMEQWKELAPLCAEHLGFDPREWERYRAGGAFIAHTSVPDGKGGARQFHPAGDTHPGRPEPIAWAKEFDAEVDVTGLETEELPGFGAVFRHKPGTDDETYLSFKAGPNRGHYHGDQLSIHYAAGATPLAIDHRVSYSPRAGQEHTHNRMSFSLPGDDTFAFANMDGYERLIAFQENEFAEVAVAQVSSPRLRAVKEFPPEDWDDQRRLHYFEDGGELTYRRTVVHVLPDEGGEGPKRDYFVIHDQWMAPEEVTATYNLHVRGETMERDGGMITFDGMTLFVAEPEVFDFASWPSTAETWLTEAKRGESTQGARVSRTATNGEFITVLYPGNDPPTIKLEQSAGGPEFLKIGETDRIYYYSGRWLAEEEGPVKYGVRPPLSVERKGRHLGGLMLVDPDRSQGRIGLFVPDVGYPFGPIPEWLREQRVGVTGEDVGAAGAATGPAE